MTIFKTKADYLAAEWEAGNLEDDRLVIDEFLLLHKHGRIIPERLQKAYIDISVAVFEHNALPRKKSGRPAGKGTSLDTQRQAAREYIKSLQSGAGHKKAIAIACDICCGGERNVMRYIKKHRFWEEMVLGAEEKHFENIRLADGLRRLYLETCCMEVHDRDGRLLFYRVPRDDEKIFRMPDGDWITVAVAREILRMADEMLEEHARNIENRARSIYEITRQLHLDRCNSLEQQKTGTSKEKISYQIEAHEHALTAYAMLGEFIIRSIDVFGWSPRSRAALEGNRQRMLDIQSALASLDPLTADTNAP